VTYRSVAEEDLDELVDLITRCDALRADWAPDWTLPGGHAKRERGIWDEDLGIDGFHAEVAVDGDGRILGVVATAGPDHVTALFVEPAMHGRRIGSRLLARAEDWLREGGCERATLNVLEGAPAEGFYEAHGWLPTGERDHFDWFDAPTVGYAKDL
jgi:GNAT superfamily N-acetyltransferase